MCLRYDPQKRLCIDFASKNRGLAVRSHLDAHSLPKLLALSFVVQ